MLQPNFYANLLPSLFLLLLALIEPRARLFLRAPPEPNTERQVVANKDLPLSHHRRQVILDISSFVHQSDPVTPQVVVVQVVL